MKQKSKQKMLMSEAEFTSLTAETVVAKSLEAFTDAVNAATMIEPKKLSALERLELKLDEWEKARKARVA
jgi:hypothetical protein